MPRNGPFKARTGPTRVGSSSLDVKDEGDTVSHRSALSSSVTLFTLGSVSGDGSALRRSPRKRVKLESDEIHHSWVSPCGAGEIEDTIQSSPGVEISPLIALRNRLAGGTIPNPLVAGGVQNEGSATTAGPVGEEEDTKELFTSDSPLSSAPSSPRHPRIQRKGKAKSEPTFPHLEIASSEAPKVGNTRPSLSTPAASPSKAKGRARSQKPVPTALATPHPAPENWEEVYGLIREMRSKIVAPVDTMGCDQAQHKESDPRNRRFATLVSLMLSSQTKDEVTDAAVTKLRAAVGGTLSIENMIATDDEAIAAAINKVGFWRRKTDYLKQTALKLQSDFSSDVPKTADELCSLPGVGPKMAFLALQVCWDLNLGIGVDVHVHRITNRLGWHRRPTKTPEETRLNLQSWLPKEHHREINHMLVGFGQVRCLPLNPKCGECVLSSKALCPSARVATAKKPTTGGKKRKVEVEVEEPMGSGAVKLELETRGLLKIAEDADVKIEPR